MFDTRITIRGFDPELHKKVRGFAVQRGITTGEALNILLTEYFEIKVHESKPAWRQPK